MDSFWEICLNSLKPISKQFIQIWTDFDNITKLLNYYYKDLFLPLKDRNG